MLKKIFIITFLIVSPLSGKNPVEYVKNLAAAACKTLLPIDNIAKLKELQQEINWAGQAEPVHILNQCQKIYQNIEDQYDTEVSVYFRQKNAPSQESLIKQSDRLLDDFESLSKKEGKKIDYIGNLEINRKKLARYKTYLEKAEETAKQKLKTKEYEKEAKIFGLPANQLRDEYKKVVSCTPKLKKDMADQLKVLNKLTDEALIIIKTEDGMAGLSLKTLAQNSRYPEEYKHLQSISCNMFQPSMSRALAEAKSPTFTALSNFLSRFAKPITPKKFKKIDIDDMPWPNWSKDIKKLNKAKKEYDQNTKTLTNYNQDNYPQTEKELLYFLKYRFKEEEEKKEYQQQAKIFHPDKNPDDQETFKTINSNHTMFKKMPDILNNDGCYAKNFEKWNQSRDRFLSGKDILEPNTALNATMRNIQRKQLIKTMKKKKNTEQKKASHTNNKLLMNVPLQPSKKQNENNN